MTWTYEQAVDAERKEESRRLAEGPIVAHYGYLPEVVPFALHDGPLRDCAPCRLHASALATFRALQPGLDAVLERLRHGAEKHPGEAWRRASVEDHLTNLIGHVVDAIAAAMNAGLFEEASVRVRQERGEVRVGPWGRGPEIHLSDLERDDARREGSLRRHLAAIACRALMALTVDADG